MLILFLAGCGYSIRDSASLPFTEISIAPVLNTTTQPDLEDIFHRVLTEEFIRQGIEVSRGASYSLKSTLRDFSLRTVSEKNEFSFEYEALIKGDFVLTGPDGSETKLLSRSPAYLESFIAEAQLNTITTLQDIAIEKALSSLARRIVTELIYQ